MTPAGGLWILSLKAGRLLAALEQWRRPAGGHHGPLRAVRPYDAGAGVRYATTHRHRQVDK
jgi:hypothetical protein